MRDIDHDGLPGSRAEGGGGARPEKSSGGARIPARRSPFERRIGTASTVPLVDDILPPGSLLEFVSVDVLNCYINYVELRAVITERDPEEEERHISMSNRFYTHFHEFGTVIHVLAASAKHWWYFCYDIDASDCAIGRVGLATAGMQEMIDWIYGERVSERYPVVEIDVKNLQGWRSFQ
ncbi:MAG: hypothetical protein ABIR47_07570 [Candidatus Kapaibacterium sp.]